MERTDNLTCEGHHASVVQVQAIEVHLHFFQKDPDGIFLTVAWFSGNSQIKTLGVDVASRKCTRFYMKTWHARGFGDAVLHHKMDLSHYFASRVIVVDSWSVPWLVYTV